MIVVTFIFTHIAVSDLGRTLKITLFSHNKLHYMYNGEYKKEETLQSSVSFVLYCYGIVGDVRYLVVVISER